MLLCRPEVQKKHHMSVGVLFSVQVEVALHRVLWQFSTNERIALVGAIHSLKLTWPLKMVVSNRNLLFQGSIFRVYVSFREGICASKFITSSDCSSYVGPRAPTKTIE